MSQKEQEKNPDLMKQDIGRLSQKNKTMSTRTITTLALLIAIAAVLQYLEFPIPFCPPFLKMDVSDTPAVFASLVFGPVSGIIVELLKNVIHLPVSSTMGVGELANFLAGTCFCGATGLLHRHFSSAKGQIFSVFMGTVVMIVFTCFFNYFFLLAFYARLFGTNMDTIVKMAQSVNPLVTDVKSVIVFVFIPFNLLKGILSSILPLLIYNALMPMMKRHFRKGKADSPSDPFAA